MKFRWWLAAGGLLLLVLLPQAGDGCGPFIETMKFTAYHGLLQSDLDAGQYGVIRPHFVRRELLLAYRALSGVPLSEKDDTSEPAPASGSVQDWLKARQEVAGAPALSQLATDRKVPGGDYQEYANCLDGAFQSAIAALRQRIAQWGAGDPQTAEWLRGQDQVFQNCAGGAVIPPALPNAAADLAADRQYQIAAAEFYAEQYDRAETDFDRIAADAKSRWHEVAPYLVARACIRHATIGGKQDKLGEAEKRLDAILHDAGRKQWHAAAGSLLEFVQSRAEPQARLVALGDELMKPESGPRLSRILTDYTRIWDRLEETKGQPPVQQSDVAAWIATFQHPNAGPADWRSRRTLPWLVAALVWAPDKDPSNADLIRDARAVPADSPPYASAVYYGILRQIRSGEPDAARQWADDAISKLKAPSAINMLRAERLRLARDWPEFLRYATRKPVATSIFDDSDDPMTEDETKAHPVAFDEDAAEALDRATPLSLWIEAVRPGSFPEALQAGISRTGWVRAVLLGDVASARTLAQRTADLNPELRAEMQSYLAEKDPAAAHFAAVFLMLRGPGFEPAVRAGFGRQDKVMESDILRDNWWLLGPPSPANSDDAFPAMHEALYDLYPDGRFIPPAFLPTDRRAAGEGEWQKIQDRAASGVDYLCGEAIGWSKSHPRDSRVPQALHECVVATHYGPTDKASTGFSKQAFEILHRNYPNSEWAKQTKYWY